ncbi:transposase [Bathymodiolus thermophilus thioautotrophic gill symbiont]|uniref:Transposase IS200-like domain-containing protein n=1 Tax=Bathymodiolus thermophilus thioautotrophic gill symbiont TaxID=2360 RepID=A0A1J5U930_9GAMM|nr:hypothetical protein BGC33_06250 [Bathymodiolus thermophilus thioautotrophic gill symbiont]
MIKYPNAKTSQKRISILANIPHRITQRGNRNCDVFFCDANKDYYLELLQTYTNKRQVDILAYCLMTNHIHLILKLATADACKKF